MQSFYVDSRTCVRVIMDVSEWFPVYVEFRQGCVKSPWLFNVCIKLSTFCVILFLLSNGENTDNFPTTNSN